MSDQAEARIPCPQCGNDIHPVAGRCKYCKADLAALRASRPQAQASLPALLANTGKQPAYRTAAAEPMSALARASEEVGEAPILPPRPTGRMFAARAPRGKWPIVVILVSIVAIGASAIAIVVSGKSKSASAATSSKDKAKDPKKQGSDVKPDPDDDDDKKDLVKAPQAGDLKDYVRNLTGSGALTARIVTSAGTITCTLFEQKAPRTVANFVGLATGKKPWRDSSGQVVTDKPFYDGLLFHRVIDNFMIQGGDPLGTGKGGPGYTFPDEIDPDVPLQKGSLVMANAGKDTNGSQFYITDTDPTWLKDQTVFGQCEPSYVIHRISMSDADASDKPTEDVKIYNVKIEREEEP